MDILQQLIEPITNLFLGGSAFTSTEQEFKNLPTVLFLLIVAWLLFWLLRRTMLHLAQALPARSRPRLTQWIPVLRLLFQLVSVMLVIMLLTESPIATLVSVLVAIGVIMRDYFSSLIAGIIALWETPYRPGDWVELGGHYGKVKEVGLRTVHLVTPDDTLVIVPHATIWNGVVANANDGQPDHLCVANFYLHPDHNAKAVRQKLRDVAITSPYIRLDKDAKVIVLEKPWGTHYRVKGYPVAGDDEFMFISDLTVRGKDALRSMDCQFATVPHGWDLQTAS